MELFGSLLKRLRETRGIQISSLSKKTGIDGSNLRKFENRTLMPLPEEVENLITALEISFQSANALRNSAETIIGNSSFHNEKIEVIPEQAGGIHPWAQTIYATELSSEGPILTILGYLSARTRPLELTLKQYEWDGADMDDIEAIRDVLIKRRENWQRTLHTYPCRDIYPKKWVEKYCNDQIWFGKKIDTQDVIDHLNAVEEELINYSNYQIGLLTGEELYFNFLIQGNYVLIEGGYEIEPKAAYRIVGGLRISISEIVNEFREEFERIWQGISEADRNRESVVAWFRNQRIILENKGTG